MWCMWPVLQMDNWVVVCGFGGAHASEAAPLVQLHANECDATTRAYLGLCTPFLRGWLPIPFYWIRDLCLARECSMYWPAVVKAWGCLPGIWGT